MDFRYWSLLYGETTFANAEHFCVLACKVSGRMSVF